MSPRNLLLLVLPLVGAATFAGPPQGPRPPPNVPATGPVTRVQISEEVDHGLAAFVKRVLADKPAGDIVLLELNTLGGRLDSALVIRDALLQSAATTVCWVKPRAISAGALIALACDVLAVTPDATMGAATPVTVSMGGDMEPVEEKVVSYVRTEMAATAKAKGRSADLAMAMVDADVEIDGLSPKGKLLTLDAKQALEWRMAEVEAPSEGDLWRALGRDLPHVHQARPSPAESFARLLATRWVSVLLIALGLLGIALEVFHPQGGAALIGGLFSLGLFFFGHLVVNLAGLEELALFVAGLVFIAIEWWLPGHTIFGVVGLKLVFISLVLGLLNLGSVPLGVAWGEGWIQRALATTFAALTIAAGALALLMRTLPASRLGRALILDTTVAGVANPVEDKHAADVGLGGVALTDLRPFGRVEVFSRKADARVEAGFVRAGSRVRVVRVEGDTLIVREEEGAAGETKEAVG